MPDFAGLVLGGDLAAGIEALIPGLEPFDARIAHANAAALATGFADFAEAAPGIGRAADQMGRLSAAMVSVNQAGDEGGPSAHRPAATDVVGLPGDATGAGVSLDFGHGRWFRPDGGVPVLPHGGEGATGPSTGDPTGAASTPGQQELSGFDAVMPALLAGDFVEHHFVGIFTREAQDAALRPDERVLPVGVARAGMLVADAATSTPRIYASAVHVLPASMRDVLAPDGSERDEFTASLQPALGRELARVIEPRGQEFGGQRVDEIADLIPTLTRQERGGPMGAAMVEPLSMIQQAGQAMGDMPPPVVRMPGVDMAVRQREAMADASSLATQRRSRAEVPRHSWEASTHDGGRGPGAATQNGFPEWLTTLATGSDDSRDRTEAGFGGLSSGLLALGASKRQDGSIDRASRGGHGSPFAAAGGRVAPGRAADTIPHAWLNAAKATAAAGAGFLPALTAVGRDRGMGVTPPSHGYHPHGDQPGPVIQHVTYLHLDDREIARAVTRQQLRMMGGNVSGTLRPDPSIAPQYGAHLLET